MGFLENEIPRDAATGRIQWNPFDWSVSGSISRRGRQIQMAYKGYRRNGYGVGDAAGWSFLTQAQVVGSVMKGAEIIGGGTSIQGHNYGERLRPSDYVLSGVGIVADIGGTIL